MNINRETNTIRVIFVVLKIYEMFQLFVIMLFREPVRCCYLHAYFIKNSLAH